MIKLILLFFLFTAKLLSTVNLEENLDSFVLSTKRIIINEYKNAFNASIIRFDGRLLLSFRIIKDPNASFNSNLGLIFLSEEFEPIGEPQILDFDNGDIPCRAEDGRLILVNDKLYFIYCNNTDEDITRGGFRVYISELYFDGENFHIVTTDCLRNFEGVNPNVREKNWVPFEYEGNLLLAYSLLPHKILKPILGNDFCDTIAVTDTLAHWKYGELRGGTPALLDGDQYISFFHSSVDMLTAHSNGRSISHYFMGAYTFSSKPPFEITKISPKPIIGKGFYIGEYYKPYWKSVRCVFPCGILIENPYIYITYGRQDYEIWIAKIDKEALLSSLNPL